MLPRQYRLRRSQDFSRLRREGKAFHSRLLLISIAPNTLPHNRYGFVTSKALGNAVTRNRARRQLREVIRQLHPRLQPGYDVVVVAKRAIVQQPSDEVARTVNRLVHQAQLLTTSGEQDATLDSPEDPEIL
ncbi:MAG: ribonuclease P protein component [Chloroflexota bacterium]